MSASKIVIEIVGDAPPAIVAVPHRPPVLQDSQNPENNSCNGSWPNGFSA